VDFRDVLRLISGPLKPDALMRVARYLTAGQVNVAEGELDPGLVQLTDGTVWVVNPDGSLTQVGSGGAGSISVTDGSTTVDPATALDFTGATVTDEGGGTAGISVGGSMPQAGVYVFSLSTFASDAGGNLPWAFQSETELLDLTDPMNPTVLDGGVYTVTSYVNLRDSPVSDGGYVLGILGVGDEAAMTGLIYPGVTTDSGPFLTVGFSATGLLEAGDSIFAFVNNQDHDAGHDFDGGAYVVKVA
jgi:hypothetical protein